jgi:S1-C subfamily serine protease
MRTFLAAAVLVTSAAMSGTAAAADDPGAPETSAQASPAQRLSPFVQPGIVYITSTWSARILDTSTGFYVRDEPFTTSGSCTGFVVNPDGYIATAGHCVNPSDEKYDIDLRFDVLGTGVAYALENDLYGTDVSQDAMVNYAVRYWKLVSPTSRFGDRVKYPALTARVSWGAVVSGLETSKAVPARVIDRSTFNSGDVALLKVEAEGLNALPLADDRVDTGTEIASIGYPGKVDTAVDDDYTPSLKTGTVSSSKTVGAGTTSVYEIDAAVAPGMSGGPTVDLDGRVIGVNSFGAGDSEAFNFVRPVSLIEEMLADAGTQASQSAVTKKYVKGLNAYFAGDKAVAVSNLGAVVEEQPANGFAADYLKKAKALPTPKQESSGLDTTLLLVLGGGLVLLALLAGGLLLLLRRRRRRSAAPPSGPGGPGPAPGPGAPSTPGLGATVPQAPTGPAPVGPTAGGGPGPTQPTAPLVGSGPPRASSATPAAPRAEVQGRPTGTAGFAPPAPPPSIPRQSGAPDITTQPAPSGSTPTGSEHHFCTECGTKLGASMKFCGNCGAPV